MSMPSSSGWCMTPSAPRWRSPIMPAPCSVLPRRAGAKTAEWGVTVNSVEIRDVAIPDSLQDAMSRQAQAEREKQARVILGSAEEEVAQKFVNAAKLYAQSPEALQLRAMNIIYETTKERGA